MHIHGCNNITSSGLPGCATPLRAQLGRFLRRGAVAGERGLDLPAALPLEAAQRGPHQLRFSEA